MPLGLAAAGLWGTAHGSSASLVPSFIYIGICWNNHHHMLHATDQVSGKILWANLHLLFWLSLIPFTTDWMGDNDFASLPTAVYGSVLMLSGAAYGLLQSASIKQQGPDSKLAAAVGRDLKSKASVVLYAVVVPLAFLRPWIAHAMYLSVALIWLIPDRRIEATLRHSA